MLAAHPFSPRLVEAIEIKLLRQGPPITVSADGHLRLASSTPVCHGYANGCICEQCKDREHRTAHLVEAFYDENLENGDQPREALAHAHTRACNVAAQDSAMAFSMEDLAA